MAHEILVDVVCELCNEGCCAGRTSTSSATLLDAMNLLPEEHERAALLKGLAALIETHGFETFVAAPLLEPNPQFFPDPWEPSTRGVRALALRILRYAGNSELDARVTLCSEGIGERADESVVAWFEGIEDGACVFGVDCTLLREDDAIVGTLCHEVAHAFRAWTGTAEAHDRLEEENTDLASIFLGFGILTTNNAFRFRQRSELVGGWAKTEWSTTRSAYLSPQAMAFALAAQVTARRTPPAEAKRIGDLLEPNQRAFFHAARRHFEQNVDDLHARLGIPPRWVWPAPREFALVELPENARFDPRDGAGQADNQAWNWGSNVFRVRTRMTMAGLRWGGIFGVAVGMIVQMLFDTSVKGTLVVAAIVGMVVGALYGRRQSSDTCSDPQCGEMLSADASTCPRCGGRIRGVIRRAADRLEAEEALEEGEEFDTNK